MPTASINPNLVGSLSNWITNLGSTVGADLTSAVVAGTSGYVVPQDSDPSPSDFQSFYMEDLSASISPASGVSQVLVHADTVLAPGAPYFTAALVIGVRIGAGSWQDSSAQALPPTGGRLSYDAPKPGGGVWTVADVNSIEVRFQATWQTGVETKPAVGQLSADVKYVGVAPSFDGGREVAGRLLRLYRRILEIIEIQTDKLWLLDAEILDSVAIEHWAANTVDGLGWQATNWQRGLVDILSTTLDLNRLRLTLRCLVVRHYRVLFWDTMASNIAAGFTGVGVARLSQGEKRTFARTTIAWIENAADPTKVVVIFENTEKITSTGTLFEAAGTNDQKESSFRNDLTGWTTAGSATFDPNLTAPQLFDPGADANRITITAGSPISSDGEAVGAASPSYTANTILVVSLDHLDANAAQFTYYAIQRATGGQWWRDSDATWQASKTWNAMTGSTVWARHKTKQIDVGASATTVTVRFGVPTTGVAGQINHVGHVQIEANRYATSRILTETTSVTRTLDDLSVANDSTKVVWQFARGSCGLEFSTLWSTADLAAGSTRTLLDAFIDASNYDRLFYDKDTAKLIFRRRRAGSNADAFIALSVVAGQVYSVALRWTGADAEEGLAAYTLSIMVDNVMGTDATSGGAPSQPANSTWRIGYDGANLNIFDGKIRYLSTVPFVFNEDELKGL